MEASRTQRILLTLLRPKVALPIFAVLLLLISPLLIRGHRLAGVPEVRAPFDVEAFGTVELAGAENARAEYEAAATALVELNGGQSDALEKTLTEGWTSASAEIRQWLADNRGALETWRKGTEKPDFIDHQPKDVDIVTLMPVVQPLRDFARLASLEGRRLESKGRFGEAWHWYRAVFRASRHVGRHGGQIHRLVGVALHAMAVESIVRWSQDPRVDAAQLRRALDEVRADYRMTPSPSRVFKAEYLALMNTLDREDLSEFLVEAEIVGRLGKLGLYAMAEPELSRRVVRMVFANWLSQIDRPRHARTSMRTGRYFLFEDGPSSAGSSHPSAAEIEACIERSVLSKLLLPALQQFDLALGREQAKQGAITVILAAQLYHREHGRFPARIADLVGDILEELPDDPFGTSYETMKYRRNPDGFTVWSVGPDGIDEGGTFDERDPMARDLGFEIGRRRKPEPAGK